VRIEFDMFRSETMGSFESLAEFRDIIEAQMQEVKQLDRSRIISEFKASDPDDRDEVGMVLAERDAELEVLDRKFAVTYPRLCRYSFLTMLFMHVEANLKAVCDEIAKRKKLRYHVSEFRGAVLERAKTFLIKEASLPPLPSATWEALSNLQKLRDCIVHAGGRVANSRDKADIERLTEQNLGLGITPPTFPDLPEDYPCIEDNEVGLLQIEPGFCIAIVNSVKSLFKEIFDRSGCFGPDHVVRVD